MKPLVIAGRAFQSRLIVGTGKYKDGPETQAAIEASGAEMVTVAVRRVNLDRSSESLLDFIDPRRYFLLPNTAGCYTAEEAIRAARLGREVGLSDWVKIEVIGDQQTLYPDIQATLEATRVLVKEGFTVLPYTSDDIVFAKRLIDAGAAAVMPLGAPIGSGLGLQNTRQPAHSARADHGGSADRRCRRGNGFRCGRRHGAGLRCVLMNTAIAAAKDPLLMAEAMQHAVLAGRQAFLAGRMQRKLYATASSPLEGSPLVCCPDIQGLNIDSPKAQTKCSRLRPCGSSVSIAEQSSPATGWWRSDCDARMPRLVHLAAGTIRLNKKDKAPQRLAQVYAELTALMALHQPEMVAIEEVFFSANVKSALKLGQVRGVAMLAAATCGLPVAEYAPLSIKSSVVGYGLAGKEQVQFMVRRLLENENAFDSPDAADALAIAICHIHTAQTLELQGARR